MKILELFFGDGSFSRASLKLGHEVTGIDIEECPEDLIGKIDFYSIDILKFPYKIWGPQEFDFIWASPPCDTYSTGTFHVGYRKNGIAIKEKARLHDRYVITALAIIEYLDPGSFVIENPRGLLRKQPFMKHLDRVTVCYCQYGDTRMKPTDLFGKIPKSFSPKMCRNNNPDCNHIRAKRGAKTGTQGLTKKDRSKIPEQLCIEILGEIK